MSFVRNFTIRRVFRTIEFQESQLLTASLGPTYFTGSDEPLASDMRPSVAFPSRQGFIPMPASIHPLVPFENIAA
jgi:hypothetical protein